MKRQFTGLALVVLATIAGQPASADEREAVVLEDGAAEAGVLMTGEVRGDDAARYVLRGEAGQILSVDLSSDGPGANFNILADGADAALFSSTTAGPVADVTLPADGTFAVEVFLMRSAARRDEVSAFQVAIMLNGPDFADSLAGGPDWWQVTGLADGTLADMRDGPDGRYGLAGQAGNGDVGRSGGCRMTLGTRWCSLRLSGTGLQGWVEGRWLVETAAPAEPEMPAGGPVGNGTGFDATSAVPCALAAGQPMGQCLLGVVRDGPGNAGVWIAIGGGAERYFLFEGGAVVFSNAEGMPVVANDAGLYRISVGDERYEIPEAVVYGG
jgi:hypothetical protein